MFVQDDLQNREIVPDLNFPSTKVFTMFIGLVLVPLALVAISGRNLSTLWQASTAWPLLTFMLLFLISAGTGLLMFRSKAPVRMLRSINKNFS